MIRSNIDETRLPLFKNHSNNNNIKNNKTGIISNNNFNQKLRSILCLDKNMQSDAQTNKDKNINLQLLKNKKQQQQYDKQQVQSEQKFDLLKRKKMLNNSQLLNKYVAGQKFTNVYRQKGKYVYNYKKGHEFNHIIKNNHEDLDNSRLSSIEKLVENKKNSYKKHLIPRLKIKSLKKLGLIKNEHKVSKQQIQSQQIDQEIKAYRDEYINNFQLYSTSNKQQNQELKSARDSSISPTTVFKRRVTHSQIDNQNKNQKYHEQCVEQSAEEIKQVYSQDKKINSEELNRSDMVFQKKINLIKTCYNTTMKKQKERTAENMGGYRGKKQIDEQTNNSQNVICKSLQSYNNNLLNKQKSRQQKDEKKVKNRSKNGKSKNNYYEYKQKINEKDQHNLKQYHSFISKYKYNRQTNKNKNIKQQQQTNNKDNNIGDNKDMSQVIQSQRINNSIVIRKRAKTNSHHANNKIDHFGCSTNNNINNNHNNINSNNNSNINYYNGTNIYNTPHAFHNLQIKNKQQNIQCKQHIINYGKYLSLLPQEKCYIMISEKQKRDNSKIIQLKRVLGTGANAEVREGQSMGIKYAVKIYQKNKICSKSKKQRVYTQIRILNQIPKHPNIISLLQAFENKNQIHLVFEYVQKAKTLKEYFHDHNHHLNQQQIRKIFYKIVKGVLHLHNSGVCHRDLKPANIIISFDQDLQMILKIIDFGSATNKNKSQIHCGTPNFMSPQLVMKNKQSNLYAADVWALGIILFYLCQGRYPFTGHHQIQLYNNIKNKTFHFNKINQYSEQVRNVILLCLEFDYNKRISVQELSKNCWFLR